MSILPGNILLSFKGTQNFEFPVCTLKKINWKLKEYVRRNDSPVDALHEWKKQRCVKKKLSNSITVYSQNR